MIWDNFDQETMAQKSDSWHNSQIVQNFNTNSPSIASTTLLGVAQCRHCRQWLAVHKYSILWRGRGQVLMDRMELYPYCPVMPPPITLVHYYHCHRTSFSHSVGQSFHSPKIPLILAEACKTDKFSEKFQTAFDPPPVSVNHNEDFSRNSWPNYCL